MEPLLTELVADHVTLTVDECRDRDRDCDSDDMKLAPSIDSAGPSMLVLLSSRVLKNAGLAPSCRDSRLRPPGASELLLTNTTPVIFIFVIVGSIFPNVEIKA